jgi:hypothetical protein
MQAIAARLLHHLIAFAAHAWRLLQKNGALLSSTWRLTGQACR